MKIIFLGAPGSGKGTQGERLANQFGYQQLTASSLLRQTLRSGDDLAEQIQTDMDAGRLVSDVLVWQVLFKEILRCERASQDVVLDGFPRSLAQLDFVNSASQQYDYLFYFNVSDRVVAQRICGRRVHLASGRVYHETYAPPKVPGHDDVTGEPLVHRPDDRIDVVTKRLATYHEKTFPVLDVVRENIRQGRGAIQSLITLDADQSIEAVGDELASILGHS